MLPKKNRLERKLFSLLFKKGRRVESDYFKLVYLIDKELNIYPKSAFIVSREVSKKSVLRNKLKRRARHIIFGLLNRFKNNIIFVLIFKKQCQNLKFSEFKKEIEYILNKGNLLN